MILPVTSLLGYRYRKKERRDECKFLPPKWMMPLGSWNPIFLFNLFIVIFFFVNGTCFGIFFSVRVIPWDPAELARARGHVPRGHCNVTSRIPCISLLSCTCMRSRKWSGRYGHARVRTNKGRYGEGPQRHLYGCVAELSWRIYVHMANIYERFFVDFPSICILHRIDSEDVLRMYHFRRPPF